MKLPRITRRAFSLACCAWLGSRSVRGDDILAQGDPTEGDEDESMDFSLPGLDDLAGKTLGGKQFWSDRLVFRDWRIQQNALSKHYRLLDPRNKRHASGSFEECQAALDRVRAEQRLAPLSGTAVVILHGLFRTRKSMSGLGRFLSEQGKLPAIHVGYPSTRGTVAEHAAGLAQVIAGLDGLDEIHFVAHSLGNLVIRHYLADVAAASASTSSPTPTPTKKWQPKFGRMVMLAPPNQGAEIAEKLVPIDVTRQIAGPAAWQIARGWPELAPKLATPPFPFGILAGGKGAPAGRNPILTGDDDLVVTVESTRLPGAADFRMLGVIHTTMMNDPTVERMTLEFLRHGYFESPQTRQPI